MIAHRARRRYRIECPEPEFHIVTVVLTCEYLQCSQYTTIGSHIRHADSGLNLLWTLSYSDGDKIQDLKPEFEIKSGSSTVNHLAEFYIPTLSHAFLGSLVNTCTYVVLLSIQPLNHAPTHAEYFFLYWTQTNNNHTILDYSCHPISVLTFFNIIPFGVKFGLKWFKNT